VIKLMAVGLAGSALLLAGCGSSTTPKANLPQSALATPAITPVATTYLGTEVPGATPRIHVTPVATSAAGAGPAAPPPLPSDAQTQSLADGLQYIDITPGTGPAAASGQKITVNYTGWLQSNGMKFDSSLDRNTPFPFTLGSGQVIKGWDEGIVGMKVGGKRRLIIPPALGYGAQANGKIPANSTLVFDVDLISNGQASASPVPGATP
jgi:hypothetical protein